MKIHSLDDIIAVRAYLRRVGAEARTLWTAVVFEKVGTYKKDRHVIYFGKDGIIKCKNKNLSPTEGEQEAIRRGFEEAEFPYIVPCQYVDNLPEKFVAVDKKHIFEFRNPQGLITMLQIRMEDKQGAKYYLPLTWWSDERWRESDPDGLLPLWGLENIKDNVTVFIHEGAKSARACQDMIMAQTYDLKDKLKDHPWGVELSGAAHLGWIGGALAPDRTDWSILKSLGIKRAYIVSDNDKPGVEVVPYISKELSLPVFHIQFTNEWPATFDLADEFPDKMFAELEGTKRYIGPPFSACVHPATWATKGRPDAEGKIEYSLRDHFKDMWIYVEEADLYICKDLPHIIRQEKILNNMLAPFSDVEETSKLIIKAYSGRSTGLCYRPDRRGAIITNGQSSSVNLHIPTYIKSDIGSPEPFLEFLNYMFTVPEERDEVARWCATLIARPDLRMEYAMLLVSESTGIGKTTLGDIILAPLVGVQNTSWPREVEITESSFNEWVANKRLVIVNEIYSGHSWKAYHSVKSVITDKYISVNQKFQRPYVVDNWAHILASSNSLQAMKMEEDDRRWFYPEITETRWPKEKFVKFRAWIEGGGLGVIKTWAERFNDYVLPGERAPMTRRKRELIESSRSSAQTEAAAYAEQLVNLDKPAGLVLKEVIFAIRDKVQGKVFDSDYEIRKAMTETGARFIDKKITVHGRSQYIIVNDKLLKLWDEKGRDDAAIVINLIKPVDLGESAM